MIITHQIKPNINNQTGLFAAKCHQLISSVRGQDAPESHKTTPKGGQLSPVYPYYQMGLLNIRAILQGDSIVQEIELFFGSKEHMIIFSDSAKVIFDKAKMLKFINNEKDDRKINILDWKAYQVIKESKHLIICKYVFTNADYNFAVDCDKACN